MPLKAAFIVPHPPLLVPEVGRGQEAGVAATAASYRHVAAEIAKLRPETVILLSPHATMYADYIHVSPGETARGSLAHFGAPEVTELRYDTGLVRALAALCEAEDFPAGTLGEREPALDHGTLVPLHFIREAYAGFSLVRVGLSGLSREEHYRFGMLVRQAVESLGRGAVIVASGDLSHKLKADGPYGFANEGPELDKLLCGIMESGDFGRFFTLPEELCQNAAECGLLSFVMMAGALDRLSVAPKLLSYEGPYGVGYAVASFDITGPDESRDYLDRWRAALQRVLDEKRSGEDAYVRLARHTLEHYVRTRKTPERPPGLPDELLNRQAGVFVSLKKHGQLRGCIGTTQATRPDIAAEIIQNAVWSGTQDTRFSPVREAELPELIYSVDVLGAPEPADRSMLDAKRYGVIVKCGQRHGLLLPNLEGVDTVEQQIAIALQKADIKPNERYTLERFEVVRHK